MFETMTSAFIDEFPRYLRNKKVLFTAGMCFVEFVLGIPCVFQGGIYVLQIMDWYCATFSLMLLSFTECVVISWIYGVDRFYKDIELMIGFQPSRYWKVLWCFVTPTTILFIWVFSVSQLEPVTYGSYQYPTWAIVFGWGLGLCSLAPVPIMMVVGVAQEEGPLWERVKKLARPAANWGPALPEDRQKYLASLDRDDPRRAVAVEEAPSARMYTPTKGAALKPEQKTLLSDSSCTVMTSVDPTLALGASSELSAMLASGQKPPSTQC